jgi:uncharacterized protein HemX
MKLPPQTSNDTSNERRAVPRHIRDAEHEPLEAEQSPDQGTPGRRLRLWILLVVAAALIAGLWYYNGARG